MPRKPGTHVPPAIRRRIRADFITGLAANLAEAARAHGVATDTAQTWAREEGWHDERLEYDRRARAADLPPALPAPAGQPDLASLDRALGHVGALLATERDAKAIETLTRAISRLELTRFAVTRGHFPAVAPQARPAGQSKPARQTSQAEPARLAPADKEPVGRTGYDLDHERATVPTPPGAPRAGGMPDG